jgi:hypothetical protein
MKTVIENFQKIEKRLGKRLFNDLYKDRLPKTLEVVEETDDEICVLTPFEVYGKGIQFLKIWCKREEFIIN